MEKLPNNYTRGRKLTNEREKGIMRRAPVLEETGEQCTVVFAQLLRNRLMWGEGDSIAPPHTHTHTIAGSVTIYSKTTLLCSLDSSMVSVKMFRNYK